MLDLAPVDVHSGDHPATGDHDVGPVEKGGEYQ